MSDGSFCHYCRQAECVCDDHKVEEQICDVCFEARTASKTKLKESGWKFKGINVFCPSNHKPKGTL